jgi:hypothetical protein
MRDSLSHVCPTHGVPVQNAVVCISLYISRTAESAKNLGGFASGVPCASGLMYMALFIFLQDCCWKIRRAKTSEGVQSVVRRVIQSVRWKHMLTLRAIISNPRCAEVQV